MTETMLDAVVSPHDVYAASTMSPIAASPLALSTLTWMMSPLACTLPTRPAWTPPISRTR